MNIVGLFHAKFHAHRKHVRHLIELYSIYMQWLSKDRRKAVSVELFFVLFDILHLLNRIRCVSKKYICAYKASFKFGFLYTPVCIGFVLFIVQLLLVLAGIEPNPEPPRLSTNDSGSTSDDSSMSFLHLDVQNLYPKLDLISVEYADFDIPPFTETWLNTNHP